MQIVFVHSPSFFVSSFLVVAHLCVSCSGSDRFRLESVIRLYREHHRVLDTVLYATSASLWSLPIRMPFSQQLLSLANACNLPPPLYVIERIIADFAA